MSDLKLINAEIGRDINKNSWDSVIKSLEIILKNAGPRLQIQFNDAKNKCIGESYVLKAKNKVLEETEFIPVTNETEKLRIPKNAVTILIFGQQMKFAGKDEANYKMGYKDLPDYFDSYLGPHPRKTVLVEYNLETHERLSKRYLNDIIEEIEFKDGVFVKVKTSEPLISTSRFD